MLLHSDIIISATALGQKIVGCVYGEDAVAGKSRSSIAMKDLTSSSLSAKTGCGVSVAKGNTPVTIR